jgi:hypothetical protein
MIATICSSENRPFRIAPSESGASLSTYRWSENPRTGQNSHQRREALERIAAGESQTDIAKTNAVDPSTICRLVTASATV